MEIEKYFERIEYRDNAVLTAGVLKALQKNHLLRIPFENLDIHYKVPIELNLESIFEKIVIRRRGGFCYELNSLFHELLNSIGFNVKMISARVFDQKQQIFSPEFDHLAIIAKIDSTDYLVDVGFGEFAFSPLNVELNTIQIDERGSFRIDKYDDLYYKVAKQVGKEWVPEYMFTLKKRDLSQFRDMCHYNQTSSLSHFTQNKFCSLATEKGRVTVTGNKVKITEGDGVTELPLNSEEEFLNALEKYFHIQPNIRVEFATSAKPFSH
jgi:N-hydroxyarylamine O-acetyltransferase